MNLFSSILGELHLSDLRPSARSRLRMMYTTRTAIALGLVAQGACFSPGASLPHFQMSPTTAAALTPSRAVTALMSAAGGTETMDFTLGEVRSQRDVVDEQMRPRPDFNWALMRAQLMNTFGLEEAEVAKYDELSDEDVLKACAHRWLCTALRTESALGTCMRSQRCSLICLAAGMR